MTRIAWLARWCIFATFSFRSGSSRITIFTRSTRLSWSTFISFLSRSTRGSWYIITLSWIACSSLFSLFTIITWFSIITIRSLRTWFTSRSLRARSAWRSLYSKTVELTHISSNVTVVVVAVVTAAYLGTRGSLLALKIFEITAAT